MIRHRKHWISPTSMVLILYGVSLGAADPAGVRPGSVAPPPTGPVLAVRALGGPKPALFTEADRQRMRLRTALFTAADQKQMVIRTALFTEADRRRMTLRSAAWAPQGAKLELAPSPAIAARAR